MHFEAPDESVWVGVLRLQVMVPGSRSLKDKRRAVVQLRDRIRARYELSVAEVGHLEHRSRAVVVVAMVSSEQRLIQSTMDRLCSEAASWPSILIESQSLDIARPFQEYDSGSYN